jgi:3-phenylpropionate/trans-cinnamate dioxygenase ferredoxin subunit
MTSKGENWVAICPVERLAHRTILCVRVDAVDLLLIREGNQVFVCERACPHDQADLAGGI